MVALFVVLSSTRYWLISMTIFTHLYVAAMFYDPFYPNDNTDRLYLKMTTEHLLQYLFILEISPRSLSMIMLGIYGVVYHACSSCMSYVSMMFCDPSCPCDAIDHLYLSDDYWTPTTTFAYLKYFSKAIVHCNVRYIWCHESCLLICTPISSMIFVIYSAHMMILYPSDNHWTY